MTQQFLNPKEFKTGLQTSTHIQTFIAAVWLSVTKRKKQTTCPSANECINKMWSIRTMDYDSATQRNEALTPATTWMNLVYTMVKERSHTQQAMCCMSPLMWNVRKRRIHWDKVQNGGCWAWGRGVHDNLMEGFFLLGWWKCPELDRGDGAQHC